MDTNNVSLESIKKMHQDLMESIRHNISLKLIDTSEDHKLSVYIPLERNAVGLSTALMPTIDEIYQDPKEGIIYVHYEGDEYDAFFEWDYLDPEDMIQIIEYLERWAK